MPEKAVDATRAVGTRRKVVCTADETVERCYGGGSESLDADYLTRRPRLRPQQVAPSNVRSDPNEVRTEHGARDKHFLVVFFADRLRRSNAAVKWVAANFAMHFGHANSVTP